MSRNRVKCFTTLVAVWLSVFLSCARDQQLVSIQIQPTTETFGASDIPVGDNAGANVQLKALGSYIHPPVTKDVTGQATWDSNTPDVATVSATGLLTASGLACGNSLVSATVQTNHSIGGRDSEGAIVVGHMTATVVCFNPGNAITVAFGGARSGTITSSVPGLSCASTCSANFEPGATIKLKATPDASFAGWSGCDSVSGDGTECTIRGLRADRSLTVTFN